MSHLLVHFFQSFFFFFHRQPNVTGIFSVAKCILVCYQHAWWLDGVIKTGFDREKNIYFHLVNETRLPTLSNRTKLWHNLQSARTHFLAIPKIFKKKLVQKKASCISDVFSFISALCFKQNWLLLNGFRTRPPNILPIAFPLFFLSRRVPFIWQLSAICYWTR